MCNPFYIFLVFVLYVTRWVCATLLIYFVFVLYEGHPISSDNGLISQKLLLKSELYYPLHVAMDVAYSCLKYGVFIIT